MRVCWSGCLSYLLKVALEEPLNAFLTLSVLRKCAHNARHATGCSHSSSQPFRIQKRDFWQQIRGSYQHTGLSGRCCLEIILTHTQSFQLSTASARVTIFSLSPKMSTKKRPPQFFSAGYSVSLLHILCARKIITVPRGKRKKINKEKNTQLHKLPYYNGKRVRCKRKKDMTHNSTVRPFKATSEYWKRRAWDSIPLGFLDVCQQWSALHCGSPQAVRFKLFEGLKIISVSELPKGKQRPQSACWLHYCGHSLLRRDQYSAPQCTGSERVPVRAGSSQWTR